MNSRMTKQDRMHVLLLLGAMVVLILLFLKSGTLYGSKVDWESQHWAFPDYFRKRFYETGQLLPSFAPQLGGGQNIFYLSYYGLFSPLLLPSLLLPFVDMMTYVMVVSVLGVAASVLLLYRWLRGRYAAEISFCASFLFLCAAPLLFHSHRHVMFVSYMPFLLLAILATDRYFKEKKGGSLPIMIAMMILCSYFFSVSALVFLTLYAVAVYLEENRGQLTLRGFFRDAARYALRVVTGVLLAGVLVVPTAYVLLSGRATPEISLTLKELLLPGLHLDYVLYSPYSTGFSFVLVLAFCRGIFTGKVRIRLLSGGICLAAVFGWVVFALNGGQYIDGKVLIPFLPFAAMLLADLFAAAETQRSGVWIFVFATCWAALDLLYRHDFSVIYLFLILVDVVLTGISLWLVNRHRFRSWRVLPLLLTAVVLCVYVNRNDLYVQRADAYDSAFADAETLTQQILDEDADMYRIGSEVNAVDSLNRIYDAQQFQSTLYSSARNPHYHSFYFDGIYNENCCRNSAIMSQPNNVLFDLYMGNKYLLTEEAPPVGYTPVHTQGSVLLCRNEDAFPLGYGTPTAMSRREYDALSYPERLEALLSHTIVDDDALPQSDFQSEIREVSPETLLADPDALLSHQKDGVYRVANTKTQELSLALSKPLRDQILLVRCRVDNSRNPIHEDVSIRINDVKNKLTVPDWRYFNNNNWFEFTISSNEPIETLELTLTLGTYEISDLHCYLLDYSEVRTIRHSFDELKVDRSRSVGDVLYGSIEASEDEYLQLSVPYDKGFTILVDGKEQPALCLDDGFLGTRLSAGSHTVEIRFRAPGLTAGLACTGLGLALFAATLIADRRRRRSLE